jgi:hypothetical protein
MGDFIYEEFKERVKDFGIDNCQEDADCKIKIYYGDKKFKKKIINARRSHFETGSLDHLDKIIASLHDGIINFPLPDWDTASPNLFCMLAQPGNEMEDKYISEPVIGDIEKVFVHHHKGRYIWISHNSLKRWNIDLETFKEQCNYNMDILLDDCKIEILKGPGKEKAGGINSDISWLNAAIPFTKNFKRKAALAIGWPIYFAMPTREFCYIVNIKQKGMLDFISPMLNDIWQREDLHLTRNLFSMTDNGIRVVGQF